MYNIVISILLLFKLYLLALLALGTIRNIKYRAKNGTKNSMEEKKKLSNWKLKLKENRQPENTGLKN